MNYKIIISGAACLMLFCGAALNAAWMDNSWKYRMNIVINSTPSVTNAQILVPAGITRMDDLIAKGRLNPDWSDLRFTMSDGVKTIPYWILPDYSGAYVKVPVLHNGKNLVYMYYDNRKASLVSSFREAMGVQPDADTEALYYFDEGGGGVAQDMSGNGNSARVYSGALWAPADLPRWGNYAAGMINGSYLTFSGGANSYVEIPPGSRLNSSRSLTVSFWISPGNINAPMEVIRKDDNYGAWKIWFPNEVPGSLEFSAKGRNSRCSVNNRFNLKQWTHCAATYDFKTKEMRLYINGNLANMTPAVYDIGADMYSSILISGESTFIGDFDELLIAARAFSPDEIRALYERRTAVAASASVTEPAENGIDLPDAR